MSEKLKDVSKAAHEIIEVLEDGDAIRNDGVRLTAANKNPWYVLATIYGEQEEGANPWNYDEELAAKNRRAWNGWYCGGLSDKDRADRAKKTGLEPEDLAPLSEGELDEIKQRFAARMGEEAELPAQNERIEFSEVIFSRSAFFEKMIFKKYADFSSATFTDDAYFSFATFTGCADFGFATFTGGAYFRSATFTSSAYFGSAKITGVANFGFAMFTGGAYFRSATFTGDAYFSSATYTGSVYFGSATFTGSIDFRSAKFKSATSFTDTKFLTSVPQFHATELYDDTVFSCRDQDQGKWPPLRGVVMVEGDEHEVMEAAGQKRAYNRLRLFMNKSLQLDEEQFFHRQEMRCKRELATGLHKVVYGFYEVVSDFGNSITRPLAGLAVLIMVGFLVKLWINTNVGIDWNPAMLDIGVFYHLLIEFFGKAGEPLGWSISNSLPFLGFGKLHYGASYYSEGFPVLLKIIGGVQTVFGFILLFFLGLGLRNRFRLR